MQDLTIGPLNIGLHRTIRVNPEEISNLPPSLGNFEIFKVSDYNLKNWDQKAFFIPIHEKEALWLSFHTFSSCLFETQGVAVLININDINVLNGKKGQTDLSKNNYLVCPPQLFLDGYKNEDGTVSQFVTKNNISENNEKLDIYVFETNLTQKPYVHQGFCHKGFASMEIEQGGKIEQQIYPDPHGLETWNKNSIGKASFYFINAKEFSEITGNPLPPLPKSFEDYEELCPNHM